MRKDRVLMSAEEAMRALLDGKCIRSQSSYVRRLKYGWIEAWRYNPETDEHWSLYDTDLNGGKWYIVESPDPKERKK